MKFEKKDLFTIPNILTYIRFLCVPIFLWLMIEFKLDSTKYTFLFSAFALFICASITDLVDGAIARNYNMTSDIGKIIDPLADKVLQVSTIIMLTVVGNIHWAFTAIIFGKELYLIIMTKFYMAAGKHQINQHSNVWGKVAAVLVFVAIIFAFAAGFHEIIMWMSMSMFIIGIAFALFAAGQYTIKYTIELCNLKKSGILDTLDKKGNSIVGAELIVEENVVETNCDELKVFAGAVEKQEVTDNINNFSNDIVTNDISLKIVDNQNSKSDNLKVVKSLDNKKADISKIVGNQNSKSDNLKVVKSLDNKKADILKIVDNQNSKSDNLKVVKSLDNKKADISKVVDNQNSKSDNLKVVTNECEITVNNLESNNVDSNSKIGKDKKKSKVSSVKKSSNEEALGD